MPLQDIEEILNKFRNEEEKVETLLIEKTINEDKLKVDSSRTYFPSYEDIKKRNKNLLKDFEAAKGRLRSKAIFCPSEIQWENVCREYQENPSLTVTTWKCQPPVFV